jgi:hypothetical protein
MNAIETVLPDRTRAREGEDEPALVVNQLIRVAPKSALRAPSIRHRGIEVVRRIQSSTSDCVVVAAIILGEVMTWIVADRFGLRGDPWVVALLCAGLFAGFALVLPQENEVN